MLKTQILVARSSAKRVASIANFSVTPGLCSVEEDTIAFLPKKVEKHTSEGYILEPLRINNFQNRKLDEEDPNI